MFLRYRWTTIQTRNIIIIRVVSNNFVSKRFRCKNYWLSKKSLPCKKGIILNAVCKFIAYVHALVIWSNGVTWLLSRFCKGYLLLTSCLKHQYLNNKFKSTWEDFLKRDNFRTVLLCKSKLTFSFRQLQKLTLFIFWTKRTASYLLMGDWAPQM